MHQGLSRYWMCFSVSAATSDRRNPQPSSSPWSAASTASFRTAVMRTLIETDPRPRASSATRQALTVALVKPGRGSWPYQAKNSSNSRF